MLKETVVSDLSKLRVSCETCNLLLLCMPASFTPQEIEQFDKLINHRHTLHRGDLLFRNGEVFNCLYAVRSGSFKVFTHTDDSNEQILGFYFPGEIIGFNTINNKIYSSSALALETASYCAIPFARMEEFSLKVPKLSLRVMELMSKEIAHENELITTLCNNSADEKVAIFLITLSVRFKHLGYSATKFKLSMSRQDISNYLGLSVETVSRIFSNFQKNDVIGIINKSIELLDMNKLARISHHCGHKLNGNLAS